MIPPAPWEIRHVDLAAGPQSLGPSSANAVCVWFRLAGAVLGQVTLLPADLPMPAGAVASLAAGTIGQTVVAILSDDPEVDPLGYLPGGVGKPPSMSLPATAAPLLPLLEKRFAARRRQAAAGLVSVVVCTRQRADLLVGALDSLRLDLANGHEVVVVDNGPDQATRDVVDAVPGVRYVAESRPGLSRARNTGISAATHPIVVFVDDDVRPEPGWIEALQIAFSAPDTMIATGLVLPASLAAAGEVGFELGLGFGGMGHVPLRFDQAFFRRFRAAGVPAWMLGAGACSAYRTTLFERIGGFDERLGAGSAGGCGEDSELWYRALAHGMTARYEPLCVVRHIHPADRKALSRKAAAYMHGHTAALLVQFRRHGHWGNLRRACWTLPRKFAGEVARRLFRRSRGDFDDLTIPMLAGYLRGLSELRLFGSAAIPPTGSRAIEGSSDATGWLPEAVDRQER